MGSRLTRSPAIQGIQKSKNIFFEKNNSYNTELITLEEIQRYLKQCKRRKSPGPDEIPLEFLMEMNQSNLCEVMWILNKWWKEEDIPDEELKARVVMIHKKRLHQRHRQLQTHIPPKLYD